MRDIQVRKHCDLCGKFFIVEMPEYNYKKWGREPLIKAWPKGSNLQRIMILCSLCKDCVKLEFPDLKT